ncbi:MAG: hypothetical protein WCG87_08580 [Bacteroidota bacterium]
MRYFYIILCSFCSLAVQAQTLRGLVLDGKNSSPLYPVSITNVTRQVSVYTAENGEFSIAAQSGDLITFSFIGYAVVKQTMPPTLGTERERIEMIPLNYELQEYIFRSKLSKYQIDSMERKATYHLALGTQHASVMSPASFIAERLSKRSKQVFKFQKNFVKWEQQQYIDYRYTPEIVQKQTGLEGDTLAYFMNSYPLSVDFARAATDLELKMWIRNNYKAWIKKPESERMPIADTTIEK